MARLRFKAVPTVYVRSSFSPPGFFLPSAQPFFFLYVCIVIFVTCMFFLPELRKPQSLCESILTLRNDVAPDVSYFSAASNALRISDDTVSGIGEVGGEARVLPALHKPSEDNQMMVV